MGWRRRRRGRHALGAPVARTVPVRPVLAAVAAPAQPWTVLPWTGAPVPEPAGPVPTPVSCAAPAAPAAADPESLLASISALILSGEAWADPVPPPSPTRPGVAKPLEAAGQGPAPAAAVLPVITLAVTAPAVITPAVITPAVITPAVSALQDLVAAVASETDRLPAAYVPVLAPPLPEPAAIGRVSLGFRDGSTTQLDPGCEQAAALEELALLLSLRD